MVSQNYDYRLTHAKSNYGQHYAKYYGPGTYPHCIWQLEQEILTDILKHISLSPKDSILDFATGTGRILDFLAQKFPENKIIGVDVSKEMLKVAKELLDAKKNNIELLLADITRELKTTEKLKGKNIKLITAFRFFLNAQEDLRHEALEAFKRVSDNFILIFNIHKLVPSLMTIQRQLILLKRKVKPVKGDYPIEVLTKKYIKDLLQQHGYTLRATYPVAWTTDKMYPLFLKKCSYVKAVNKTFLRKLIPSEMIFVASYKKE